MQEAQHQKRADKRGKHEWRRNGLLLSYSAARLSDTVSFSLDVRAKTLVYPPVTGRSLLNVVHTLDTGKSSVDSPKSAVDFL